MTQFKKTTSIVVALVIMLTMCFSIPMTVSAATVQVTVNNSGNIYTVDANVGEELAVPERANGMQFLGWYSDPACTVEYGKVQENETRKAYAKYPSTFIGFEGKDNYVKDTDYRDEKSSSGVVTDPTNADNKVFKLHAKNMYAALTMPQYDDNDATRYILEANHSYTFTYKFMIPGGSSVEDLEMRMNKGDLPAGGAGRTPFGSVYHKQSEMTALTWYTWSFTMNVGDLKDGRNSPQVVALWNLGKVYDTDYVYIDDVIITDNDLVYDIPAESTETSFEIGEYNKDYLNAKAGDFASSTGLFSLSSAEAHSGSTSLMYNTSMKETLRFVYAYTSTKNALKLESNKTYTISFWYKATAKSDWINIHLGLWNSIKSDNAYGDATRVDIIKQSVNTTNEWTKVSFNYTTDDCSEKPYIIIGVSGGGSAAKTVYIDDISVVECVPAAEPSDTFTSFEGCTVKYKDGFNSSSAATISNEQAKSGMSSLKIAPDGANTYRSYAYNGNNSVLKLDSYTKYTISYWYMATALGGTYTNIYTTLNGSGNVWDKNIQLNKTGIHSSALNEWHKAEYTVITGDCSSQAYLTFGLQTAAAGTVVYIDDVTVTAGEYIGMHDYYCDFSADFSHYGEPGVTNPWPYYSSNVNFNTDNGILYFPTTHNAAPSTASGTWVQHFAPYDGNDYYQFEANTSYCVSVRYKQTASSKSAKGYFSVGVKQSIPASGEVRSLAINNLTGTTDWNEYTFSFVTPSDNTLKYLTLTFGTSTGTMEYEVDYIKIVKGPFINNNGDVYINNTEVGSEIPAPNYDADKLTFVGWYSDPECTVPFGKMQENETRTAYAGYNKTIINFSEAEFTQKSTYRDDGEDYGGYESGIVLDPNDATNKVFKLHSPSIWSNFAIPVYDAKSAPSYELIAGVEYTVSVDFKIPSTITSEKLTIRAIVGDRSEGGVGRIPYDNTRINYTISNLDANKWYTYTTTFTATSDVATKPYLFISYIFDDGAAMPSAEVGIASYVYFDNVIITKIEVEEPEDSKFIAVSKRDEGVDENGKYQSAGIRFKNRVTADFRANATELGFIAVPTAFLGEMTIADYYATENNKAIRAAVLAEGMDEIVYAVSTDENGVKFYDYQMIITGLTREGSEVNLLDTEITTVMYAIVDGEMVFGDSVAYSYNSIAAMYNK